MAELHLFLLIIPKIQIFPLIALFSDFIDTSYILFSKLCIFVHFY